MDLHQALDAVLATGRIEAGVGTLSEKTLHAVLKLMYESDPDYHEVSVSGYVADILRGNHITEIQTSNFTYLKDKLATFLPNYKVRVVYPIIRNKYLSRMDKKTGELIKGRLSPKKGCFYDGFWELYNIREYIRDPNFSIDMVILDADEIRTDNDGSNKRARHKTVKYDTIPRQVVEVVSFDRIEDYLMAIPLSLGDEFTAKDFQNALATEHVYVPVYSILKILEDIGIIYRDGKKGRAILYRLGAEYGKEYGH